MPHVHISTEAMFITGLFTVGLTSIVLAYRAVTKRDRLEAEHRRELSDYMSRIEPTKTPPFYERLYERRVAEPSAADVAAVERHYTTPGYVPRTAVMPPMSPAFMSQPVYHDGGMNLLTGMLIGEAIAGGHHHDTTVIHDSAPSYNSSYSESSSYSASSPSSDSGFSYDSSSSSSYDSSSSSSYDSGSSGGFDASW